MKRSLVSRILRVVLPILMIFAICSAHAKAQEDKRVVVVNRASSPIQFFYATPVSDGRWGSDLLGPGVMIGINRYMAIDMEDGSDHCHYDFKAVLWDGRAATTHNVDVCKAETWTVTN